MGKSPFNEDIDQEIFDVIGDGSFEDIVDDQSHQKGSSTTRRGVVAAIHGRNVLIEFSPREQGCCPKTHFEELPQLGDSLEFIIQGTDKDGMLVLSRKGVLQKASWDTLALGQKVEARCTGTNKGGLEMELAAHKAFMPAGQVALHHVPDLSVMIGEKFACEVIELNKKSNRIVLSRRNLLKEEREAAKAELLGTINVGDTHEATITSVQPYGAFADIGGLEGLIHKSEMTWERNTEPEKFVKVGDVVRIQILEINLENDKPKIAFGMKQLIEDPFISSMGDIEVGEVVSGTVSKLVEFGAFIDLGNGSEGLVHISELSDQRIKSPKDVVSVQQSVKVKVISIDLATRRISLSLKQAEESFGSDDSPLREEDNAMRRMREKFGKGPLKGGIE